MLKKILIAFLFIVLAGGAVYCWKSLDFNRKTAMFFQVVFGDENSMGGPGGRPPMGENRGGDMSRPEPPNGQEPGQNPFAPSAMAAEGGERGAPPDFGQGRQAGERPAGNGGPGGPGGYISLGNVAKYTVIMAFFVMLTRLLDQSVLRMKRSRRSA